MKILSSAVLLAVSASATMHMYETEPSHYGRREWQFDQSKVVNNRPIIGVLSQPLTEDFKKDPRFANKTSYIMASYINMLESSGARTVPLIFGSENYLLLLEVVNGVFYCGGGAGGDYDKFGQSIYNYVKQMNDQGTYMPIWGTCLGFENLAMFASDNSSSVLIGDLQADDENYKLEFMVDPASSRLFGPLGNVS